MSKEKPVQTAPEALTPPVLAKDEPLGTHWKEPVARIAYLPPSTFTDEEEEKHTIYSLALMSLVRQYWNGNKKGNVGIYPWRENQIWMNQDGGSIPDRAHIYKRSPDVPDPKYDDYLGHNIACLAVDGAGDIIDFDFNHNNILSSSVDHAESRLIRRIFSLTQLDQGWELIKPVNGDVPNPLAIATTLNNVTVYTSLESCAQCSGIMTLAQVEKVVYLQKDFGTYCIGNIVYNLTLKQDGSRTGVPAPKPIPACDFRFEYYDHLNEAYKKFYQEVLKTPFWDDCKGTLDRTQAVTSFLCTDVAYEIYRDADQKFQSPKYKAKSLDNQARLDKARIFVQRMVALGRRGTPHRV